MDKFIKLFKKYFLWLFFTLLFIQTIAFLFGAFSARLINHEYSFETFDKVNLIRSELSYWLFNALLSLLVFLDMKKLKLNNVELIILTLLNGTAGATLFLFQAYYELTKSSNNE